MSFLDQFLYKNIAKLGTLLSQQRPTINFLGSGVSVADNPTTKQTDVTITGGGGSSFGKINLTLANGTNSNQATDGSLLQVIGGPTATFGLGSVLPSVSLVSGQPVVFENTVSGQLWYLVHLDPSATGSSLKFAIPGQTQAGALVPVFGKISAHFDGTNLVADLGSKYRNSIDVREFGAIPNLTDTTTMTNNVTAITAALAYFQARVQAGAAAFKLRFPAGVYYHNCTRATQFTLTNCVGGIIEGDGLSFTSLNGGFSLGIGLDAQLRFVNCNFVVIRGMTFVGGQVSTALTANCAAGSLTCTVSTGVATTLAALPGGGVGFPIRLATHLTNAVTGGYSEANTIASVNSGTGVISLATPTQRGYTTAATGQLLYGSYSGVQIYKDAGQSGDSNNITFQACGFGDGSVYKVGYGVAIDCNGGSGSASDADNANHIWRDCFFFCDIAAVKIGHRNSLLNEMHQCTTNAGSTVDSRYGGSLTIDGGNHQATDVDILISGPCQHPTILRGMQIESVSPHLRMRPIAMTTVATNFTQPASGSTVTATLTSTAGLINNSLVTIVGGGVYSTSGLSGNTIVLHNDGSAGNASGGTTVTAGSVVSNAPYQQRLYCSDVDKKFGVAGANDGAPALIFDISGGDNYIELHGGMYSPGESFSAVSVVDLRNNTYTAGPGSWFIAHGTDLGVDQLIFDTSRGEFWGTSFVAADTSPTPQETFTHTGSVVMRECKVLTGAYTGQYIAGVTRYAGFKPGHQFKVNNNLVGSLGQDDATLSGVTDFLAFGAAPSTAAARIRTGADTVISSKWGTTTTAVVTVDGSGNISVGDATAASTGLAAGSAFVAISSAILNVSPPIGAQSGIRGNGAPFKLISTTQALTNANVTLSSGQYVNPCLVLTGTLTGNVTVTFPNLEGFWVVDLSGLTLSAHTLTFASGSASSAPISTITNTLLQVRTSGSNTIAVGG